MSIYILSLLLLSNVKTVSIVEYEIQMLLFLFSHLYKGPMGV